jgi:DNA-3-methyladenine glycosylase I
VARFDAGSVDRLLTDAGIVRNRAKIEATVNHAALMALSQSRESKAMSKDLRRRGWSFVGPTTAYAFMQAMGLVNDHLDGCDSRPVVEAERATFQRPG